VNSSRSITPATLVHRRCTALKPPTLSALSPENDRCSPPQVLHCLPLQGLRGRFLEFESFDQSYLDRLRAGDYRTQEHFVAYFTPLIHIKLRSRLKSREAIEDIRQETFHRFFAALHNDKIRQPERLGPYVNSMCNNLLREGYRAATRLDSLDDEENPREFPDKGPDPFDVLDAKETENKVRETLEEQSEKDRRLLREVFLEERDKDEVCRDFGVDRDYLRVLLHRAKQSFKSAYVKRREK
jgi:RNA polymerase sigma-70 factor, ECF subfamily